MTDVRRALFEYARAQAKARAERKKEVKKLKGLDTVSSQRRRTEKMNRELSRRKRELWDLADGFCPICPLCSTAIRIFEDCEIDHVNPRGMGGGKRDDSDENLRLTHRWCNREKASKRERV